MTRGEAINWIINLTADIGKVEHRDLWHYEQALEEIRDMIEAMPLEQPERIKGRWEHRSRKIAPHNTIWWYVCSVCGGGGSITDFCPHCGADMRGGQDADR